jgi:hypothetical protein
MVNTMPWLLYPWEGDKVHTVQEAAWVLRLAWNMFPLEDEPWTVQGIRAL